MSQWKFPKEDLTAPIELEKDYSDNLYAPIEDVTERLNVVWDGLWDVEIEERDFLNETDETLVKVRVTFHTPNDGTPDIIKEAYGSNKAVRIKSTGKLKSLGDSYEAAVSQGIKRVAKRIEVALRKQFQNPALNSIEGKQPTRDINTNDKEIIKLGETKVTFGRDKGKKFKELTKKSIEWLATNAYDNDLKKKATQYLAMMS